MHSIRDIKILLFVGYAFAYPLAVLAPILIDPLLKTHVVFPSREYPNAKLCFLIYALLLGSQCILLIKAKRLLVLYSSICVFLIAIAVSLPIFLPEFPHGNLFAVGVTTAFLSAFTIFVWWIGDQISIDPTSLESAGHETFEYMKALFTFVRQGAFAGVTLFGALFFAAYSTVTDKHDLFLLKLNTGFQIGCYAIYSVVGAVRYFFIMNLQILSQFRAIAARLDRETAGKSPATAEPLRMG
jgi:hypothetical protein